MPDLPQAASFDLLELNQFLIEWAQRKAFGRVELVIQRGQIVAITTNETYKPGELPLRDRARVEALRARRQGA